MNLIAYSDSEGSGDEAPPAPKPAAKPAPKTAFHKVVDRSNPGKIKLDLPGASQPHAEKDDIESDAPPAKRARIGGAAFSGFNAMLPAPKKPKPDAAMAEAAPGKRGLGKSLGAGVNLRTGAEPAFRRQPRPELDDYDENGNPVTKEALKKEDFRALLNLPPPKTETKIQQTPNSASIDTVVTPQPDPKPVAKPRFVPMSMARGKKKKLSARPAVAASEQNKPPSTPNPAAATPTTEQKPPSRSKVSLFSMPQEPNEPEQQPTGEYQPLLHGTSEDDSSAPIPSSASTTTHHQAPTSSTSPYPPPPSNDLTNIASELNLSSAERRQLFGRKGQGPDLHSSAKIVDFNTDTEYAHNEMLRQQGETVQHNALKSISGTGKNSLRSLVNVAITQKDALEEHFASGRRNKREAGSKYGW